MGPRVAPRGRLEGSRSSAPSVPAKGVVVRFATPLLRAEGLLHTQVLLALAVDGENLMDSRHDDTDVPCPART
jgi:hypothetical protein